MLDSGGDFTSECPWSGSQIAVRKQAVSELQYDTSLPLGRLENASADTPDWLVSTIFCRHGDFFTAVLKAQPQLVNDWKAKLWGRFFCLSVYITMYLNDHQRTAFYESLGMNTREFNQHVIIETNKSVARVFPQVRVNRENWPALQLSLRKG